MVACKLGFILKNEVHASHALAGGHGAAAAASACVAATACGTVVGAALWGEYADADLEGRHPALRGLRAAGRVQPTRRSSR